MSGSSRLTAAGGLLWRLDARATAEVLLVHRPRYDDWSLPKGKPETGENALQTAAREVTEETGLPFTIGPRLGHVRYTIKSKTKVSWYWSMRLDPDCVDEPAPQNMAEIDDYAWLPVGRAIRQLTYPGDRHIVGNFAAFGMTPISLILLRHARAGTRSTWKGPDALRPLDGLGRDQAAMLGSTLGAFAPTRILAASPLRCQQTVLPLAKHLALSVTEADYLSDRAWEATPGISIGAIADLARTADRTIAVSQGKTMRAALDHVLPSRPTGHPTKKGGMWVFGARESKIETVDYYPSLLPLKP